MWPTRRWPRAARWATTSTAAAWLSTTTARSSALRVARLRRTNGKAVLAQLGDRVVGHLRGRDEQAVDLALAEHAQVGRLALRVVLRVAQDEVVAPLAGRVLGPLDDRREERVRDVRDEHPERQRPLQAEAAGEGRGPVAEAVGGREDALARRRPDRGPGVAVEDARHRGRVDAGLRAATSVIVARVSRRTIGLPRGAGHTAALSPR